MGASLSRRCADGVGEGADFKELSAGWQLRMAPVVRMVQQRDDQHACTWRTTGSLFPLTMRTQT